MQLQNLNVRMFIAFLLSSLLILMPAVQVAAALPHTAAALVAVSDQYNTIGNVKISVPDGPTDLLANDVDAKTGDDNAITAAAETKSSTHCAECKNVTINSNGSFTYNPPVGFSGMDTFTYTARVGTATESETVSITVSDEVWFVNNNAGACSSNCDGRLSHPFTSLAAFDAANDGAPGHPGDDDWIFIFESPTTYSGLANLRAGQKLIGQDYTSSIISLTGFTQPSGTDPLPVMNSENATTVNIANLNANGVNFLSDNSLHGVTIEQSGAFRPATLAPTTTNAFAMNSSGGVTPTSASSMTATGNASKNGVAIRAGDAGAPNGAALAITLLISEMRYSGLAGVGDDFIELHNNSDSPLTVAASDASAGFGLFKMGADCNASPILIGTIPNGTVIPARGHYLFVGSAYSLANYGGTGAAAGNQTLSSDIDTGNNIGIFSTAELANISFATRLDALGFGTNTGNICDLLREGTTVAPLIGFILEHSYVRDECGKGGNPATLGPCPTGGLAKDTNNNVIDFFHVEATGHITNLGQGRGAPGPQNLISPTLRNSTIAALLLDSNVGGPSTPNRVRDLTPVPSASKGTMSIRRRFVNNTGQNVTRLRFRIIDSTAFATPPGFADLRAFTSGSVVVSGITDAATCLASNGFPTTPCSVTVLGTTLETPPTQPIGGAINSSMSAGTISLATPLPNGASINLQFLLGVQVTGRFKFYINMEALTAPVVPPAAPGKSRKITIQ